MADYQYDPEKLGEVFINSMSFWTHWWKSDWAGAQKGMNEDIQKWVKQDSEEELRRAYGDRPIPESEIKAAQDEIARAYGSADQRDVLDVTTDNLLNDLPKIPDLNFPDLGPFFFAFVLIAAVLIVLSLVRN